MDRDEQEVGASESETGSDAVGIVVNSGPHAEKAPRAVAFVWGPEVRPAPSLPFGRWKTELSAA